MSLVDKSIEKKTWREFKKSFGFKVMTRILHLFGWYLIFTTVNNEIVDVDPYKINRRK